MTDSYQSCADSSSRAAHRDLSLACQFTGAAKPHYSCTFVLGLRVVPATGICSTTTIGGSESGPGLWGAGHLEGLAAN